jgi:NADPH2:quinone reductase
LRGRLQISTVNKCLSQAKPVRDQGIYIPVRGWGDKPAERGIEIRQVFVLEVLERTEWLELLRDMVAAAEIKLRVAGEYAPEQTADAQRALESGGLRGRLF